MEELASELVEQLDCASAFCSSDSTSLFLVIYSVLLVSNFVFAVFINSLYLMVCLSSFIDSILDITEFTLLVYL